MSLVPILKPAVWAIFLGLSCPAMAVAAANGCASLAAMPAVVEIDQGIQQAIHSPVAITRLAVGDPKIADVFVSGNDGFLLTGVGPGATSLMVWTSCSSTPRQSMVFVRGRATVAMAPVAG
jgi:pilus assembly protein CpaC